MRKQEKLYKKNYILPKLVESGIKLPGASYNACVSGNLLTWI